MKIIRSGLCFAALATLLLACGVGPNLTKTFTEQDVVDALGGLIADIQQVRDLDLGDALVAARQFPANQPGCPEVELLFELITFTSSASELQSQRNKGTVLARGSYVYDPDSESCTRTEDGEALTVRYPYTSLRGLGQEAVLYVDWATGSDTLELSDPAGNLVEVPTQMKAGLKLGGDQAADLSAELSWFNAPECGTDDGILEPIRVRVSGSVGSVTLSEVGYDLSETMLNLGGALEAEAGLSLTAELNLDGTLSRGPCYVEDFEVEDGSLSATVASSVNETSHSFALNSKLRDFSFADFSNALLGEMQGLAYVTLQEGAFDIDGDRAATFAGIMDDANQNGVSGEKVTIDFSAGERTDLESFLTENEFGVEIPAPE